MELDKYGKLCAYGDIRWVQYESFKFDFLKEVESKIRVVPENGFIKGNTLDGQFIYLHLAEPFDFKRKAVQFSTDAYIKGKSLEEQKCKGMRFTGGVLGLLFIPDKLELNLDNGKFIAQCQDDAFCKSFEASGKKYSLTIESSVEERVGISGKALVNEKIILDIMVEDGLSLSDIIPLYSVISKICQFLTFRKNVLFDKIELLGNSTGSEYCFAESLAELHVINENKVMTEKPWISCVSFREIDDGIGLLFKAIIEEKEKKPHFQMDFIPENDEDAMWITPEKIRRICTCLECEAALQSITIKGDQNFKELIDKIKDIIDEHKKGDNPLSPKAYSLIEGSMRNWDSAAGDKVKALFHKFDEILITSRSFNYSDVKFEEEIDKIIRFRNTTTHGNYMRIEGEYADIAINLMTLIYISRLSRFGMKYEKIRDLINRGIVYG